jgi:hypothetical protein
MTFCVYSAHVGLVQLTYYYTQSPRMHAYRKCIAWAVSTEQTHKWHCTDVHSVLACWVSRLVKTLKHRQFGIGGRVVRTSAGDRVPGVWSNKQKQAQARRRTRSQQINKRPRSVLPSAPGLWSFSPLSPAWERERSLGLARTTHGRTEGWILLRSPGVCW